MIYKNTLKGIRVSKGLTQGNLATLINMPKSTYIKKENEQTLFNIKEAIDIAIVLNVDLDTIFLKKDYHYGNKH